MNFADYLPPPAIPPAIETVTQPPPEPSHPPGSLAHAVQHMDRSIYTEAAIQTQLESFYKLSPAQIVHAYAAAHDHLNNSGNTAGTGPQMLLLNHNKRLQVAHSLLPRPDEVKTACKSNSNFHKHDYVLCLGDRPDDQSLPTVLPISDDFFAHKHHQLATFTTASEADPTTVTPQAILPFTGAPAVDVENKSQITSRQPSYCRSPSSLKTLDNNTVRGQGFKRMVSTPIPMKTCRSTPALPNALDHCGYLQAK